MAPMPTDAVPSRSILPGGNTLTAPSLGAVISTEIGVPPGRLPFIGSWAVAFARDESWNESAKAILTPKNGDNAIARLRHKDVALCKKEIVILNLLSTMISFDRALFAQGNRCCKSNLYTHAHDAESQKYSSGYCLPCHEGFPSFSNMSICKNFHGSEM